ncbi:MAG: permease [Micromonosporaceae bacterium]
MPWITNLLGRVAADVWSTVAADWPYLLVSIVAASAVPVYLGTDRLGAWMSRRRWVAIGTAVILATLTPFCSCGTTAIVLGMLATRAPWAPIVAFMVASPLTSPEELFLSAGLFGWPFALLFFVGTIALGFAAGGVTALLERTGWLAGQARMRAPAAAPGTCAGARLRTPAGGPGTCAAGEPERCAARRPAWAMHRPAWAARGPAWRARSGAPDGPAPSGTVLAAAAVRPGIVTRLRIVELARQLRSTGLRLGLYFLGYGTLGYLVIEMLPAGFLTGALGGRSPGSVVFAAALGIPVYITTEASLPMVAALVHGGLGLGPAMAFLVTGAGTSVGAISGAFLIARIRVIALVVGLLFAGAVILGWLSGAVLG